MSRGARAVDVFHLLCLIVVAFLFPVAMLIERGIARLASHCALRGLERRAAEATWGQHVTPAAPPRTGQCATESQSPGARS
jgi:hypothetical protein